MAATQTEEKVSLKLLVNEETNKVLFAEAGKDFVDVLVSFLTLPLGTIARLVQKESNMGPVTVGCLNPLYQSLADLDEKCLWSVTYKDMLLKPRNLSECYCRTLRLNIDDTEPQKYFVCSELADCDYDFDCDYRLLSISPNETCRCGYPMDRVFFQECFENGFVKGGATFIITDDLIVMPYSMDLTSFGLLQNFGVKSVSSIKEITVNVTKEKVLDLLKCSLISKSTLTHLFLEKKSLLEGFRFSPCVVEDGSSLEIKVKVVMRKSDGKILYAQGEEDFADFLFSFLTFPLGAVIRKFGGDCSVGSLDGLYKSIADLNEDKYLTSKKVRCRLVDPRLAPQFKLSRHILPICEPYTSKYYYLCSGSSERIIHDPFSVSAHYSDCVLELIDPKSPTVSHKGYVKGLAVFIVTDDLVVAPMSPISAIFLHKRLETPPSDMTEKDVIIGLKEGLRILKAALTSTSALTNGLGHLLTQVKEGN